MRGAREGDDYTEDTLSDKANTSTCDPGCGQGTRYQCKDGYAYDSKSESCKLATCHIEEAPNPAPDNCKYDLKLNTYDAIPSEGIDKPAGTSVRVWAYRQDPYVISDIKGINGQFQVSSYSGYKDFTCEAGETYRLYATCGEGCAEFPLEEKRDENCWDCYTCPASNNRFQCTLSEKSGYKWDYSTSTCKVKVDDPNEGKTYYITVNQDLTIQGTPTGSGTETILQFWGTITLPDVSNDEFFTKNEISFAAQPHIYAKISCDGGDTKVEPGDGYGTERLLGVSSNINQTADKRTMTFSYSETPWLKSYYSNCTVAAKGVNKDKSIYGLKVGSFSSHLPSIPSDYVMTSDCKTITIDGSSRKICVKYSDTVDNSFTVKFATTCPNATHSNTFGVTITSPDKKQYIIGECQGDSSDCNSNISTSVKIPYQSGSFSLSTGCVYRCGGSIYEHRLYENNELVGTNTSTFTPKKGATYRIVGDCEGVQVGHCGSSGTVNVYMASGRKKQDYCQDIIKNCGNNYYQQNFASTCMK